MNEFRFEQYKGVGSIIPPEYRTGTFKEHNEMYIRITTKLYELLEMLKNNNDILIFLKTFDIVPRLSNVHNLNLVYPE